MKNDNLTPEEEKRFEEFLAKRDPKKLIIHDDDVNTFKDVIFLLVRFCGHDEIQAEQCANFIHYKGRCHVKSGSLQEMHEIEQKLVMNNLTVSIE